MKKITFTLLTLMVIMSGCSKNSIRDNVDGFMQWTSGNKPPQFFMFANPKTADSFTLQHKDFNVSAPLTYEKDWQKMLGWRGGFIYGGAFYSLAQYRSKKTGGIVLDYTFEFTTAIYPYTDREREIEKKIKNFPPQRTRSDGETINVDLHYEKHGKENYPCIVNSSYNLHRGIYKKYYGCYKFNPEKTKAKKVGITFIYTKSPTLPKELEPLAKEYTYEDLLERSQRVLDSLYIKDGWDE